MNYIWAGLIITSLVFAMVNDVVDLVSNNWENGVERRLELRFPINTDMESRQDILIRIAGDSIDHPATWRPTSSGNEILIPVNDALPEQWRNIAANQDARDQSVLAARVVSANEAAAIVTLPEVKFVKMRAIAS